MSEVRKWEQRPLLSATSLIPERLLAVGHRMGRSVRRDYVGMTPQQIRLALDQLSRLNPGPFGAHFEMTKVGQTPTAKVTWPNAERRSGILLLVHGGGFAFGSARTHRALAVHLARTTGHEVWIPEYRLAPEHPFPAALEDLQAIALSMDVDRQPLVAVVGDSAGGNLAASLVQWLASLHPKRMARGCVLMSPWWDLSPQSRSNVQDAEAFSLFDRYDMLTYSNFYLQGANAQQPMASPLRGDFAGFPPTYLEGSLVEYLQPDIALGKEKLQAAGVDLVYREEEMALHGWQLFPDALPEARRSVEAISDFVKRL